MKSSKGFTLIELLVVIAIIGILSSVVLASLNTARAKGSNAAIKSQLAAIRPQAEIYYDTWNSYGTSTTNTVVAAGSTGCTQANSLFLDPTIKNQVIGVYNTAGSANCIVTPTTINTAWAVDAPLKVSESGNTRWCVDSSGASKGNSTVITTAVCP